MRLHDTARRTVLPVTPSREGLLRIYSCGLTVGRDPHLGDLRTLLLTDLVRRTAEMTGLSVLLVQGVMDVGHSAEATRGFEERFHADLSALNIHPAQAYPRASESIDLIVDLISTLIGGGHAYVDGGDASVYFDARSFPGYGALSGITLHGPPSGSRSEDSAGPAKRFYGDWVLWRASPGFGTVDAWDSPWGPGSPGRHVACSALSLALLGDAIDLETGSIDLTFPHHENERAQTDSAAGAEVTRHWTHGEHLLFDGRVIRDAGTAVTVADVAARGIDPLALRLALLKEHYRRRLDLTWEALDDASVTLARWRLRLGQWATHPSVAMPERVVGALRASLDDDLDTPGVLSTLHELERTPDVPPGAKFETFAFIDRVLGLDLVRRVGQVT